MNSQLLSGDFSWKHPRTQEEIDSLWSWCDATELGPLPVEMDWILQCYLLFTVLSSMFLVCVLLLFNQGDDAGRSRNAFLGKCKETVHVRCGSPPRQGNQNASMIVCYSQFVFVTAQLEGAHAILFLLTQLQSFLRIISDNVTSKNTVQLMSS